MKHTPIQKHRGFFDMGISLVILALGGTTAAVVNTAGPDAITSAQPEQVIQQQMVTSKHQKEYEFDC